jgi:DNA primase
MEALVKYLNSDVSNQDDLQFCVCPFCKTTKSSMFLKRSDNKYRCFKCGVSGDLISLRSIINHKYDYS